MIKGDFIMKINVTSELHLSSAGKKALKVYEEYASRTSNPKFHRTSEESNASFHFSSNNSSIIKSYEKKICNCFASCNKSKTLKAQINACDRSLEAFYEFKEFCYNSYEGTIYFQNMWEYCHNSKSECFSFDENINAHKEKLERACERQKKKKEAEKRKERLQEQKEKEAERLAVLSQNLQQDVFDVLQQNSPMLQCDLFKFFDSKLKKNIIKILEEWESCDAISRIKSKNSYMITLTLD